MLKNLIDFANQNPEKIAALLAAVYEVFARIRPTNKNWSIIDNVCKVIMYIIPNRSKKITTVKNDEGVVKVVDTHVLRMIVMFLMMSITSFGQLNSTFKAARSYNADSLTVKTEVTGLQLMYGDIGALYYNHQHNPGKWRIFYDSTWHDLIGGGGGGGSTSPGLPFNSIQFNNAGNFGGNSGLLYTPAVNTVTQKPSLTQQILYTLETLPIVGTTTPNGFFHSTLDQSYVNGDSVRDAVWQFGFNQDGRGGRVNSHWPSFHLAYEPWFDPGNIGHPQGEFHIQFQDTLNIIKRLFSLNVNNQSGSSSSFWHQNSMTWFEADSDSTYFSIDNNGQGIITGRNSSLEIANDHGTPGDLKLSSTQAGGVVISNQGSGVGQLAGVWEFPNPGSNGVGLTMSNVDGSEGYRVINSGTSTGTLYPFFSLLAANNGSYYKSENTATTSTSDILDWYKTSATGGSPQNVYNAGTTFIFAGLDNTDDKYKIGKTYQWATNNFLSIDQTGVTAINNLSGSGSRMVVADASGVLSTQTIPSGGSPASPVTSVQFNDSGSFGGDAEMVYDKTSDILTTSNLTLGVSTASGTNRTILAGGSGGNVGITTTTKGLGAWLVNTNNTGVSNVFANNNTTAGSTILRLLSGVTGAPKLDINGGSGKITIVGNASTIGGVAKFELLTPNVNSLGSKAADIVIQPGDQGQATDIAGDLILQGGTRTTASATRAGNVTISAGTGGGVNGFVILSNLPTTCTGAPTGALANVAGVLTICP